MKTLKKQGQQTLTKKHVTFIYFLVGIKIKSPRNKKKKTYFQFVSFKVSEKSSWNTGIAKEEKTEMLKTIEKDNFLLIRGRREKKT